MACIKFKIKFLNIIYIKYLNIPIILYHDYLSENENVIYFCW